MIRISSVSQPLPLNKTEPFVDAKNVTDQKIDRLAKGLLFIGLLFTVTSIPTAFLLNHYSIVNHTFSIIVCCANFGIGLILSGIGLFILYKNSGQSLPTDSPLLSSQKLEKSKDDLQEWLKKDPKDSNSRNEFNNYLNSVDLFYLMNQNQFQELLESEWISENCRNELKALKESYNKEFQDKEAKIKQLKELQIKIWEQINLVTSQSLIRYSKQEKQLGKLQQLAFDKSQQTTDEKIENIRSEFEKTKLTLLARWNEFKRRQD